MIAPIRSRFASRLAAFTALSLVLSAAACSTSPKSARGGQPGQVGVNGPGIEDSRVEPEIVQLDRYLRPTQPARIITEIQDYSSPIVEVSARFLQVPLEVPLRNIGHRTWSADLTPQQLRMLSVTGQTMRYDAAISVRDAQGHTVVSPDTFQVAISAPDITSN
jgi:hypothetical protein